MVLFFFSSRRRHTRCGRDWSSDVCSSDLDEVSVGEAGEERHAEWQQDLGRFPYKFEPGEIKQVRQIRCREPVLRQLTARDTDRFREPAWQFPHAAERIYDDSCIAVTVPKHTSEHLLDVPNVIHQ